MFPSRSGAWRRRLASSGLAASLVLAACSQKMANQPRYDLFEPSSFFADGQSARQSVADTVARGQLRDDPLLSTGKSGDVPVDQLPFPLTRELLQRGEERSTSPARSVTAWRATATGWLSGAVSAHRHRCTATSSGPRRSATSSMS